MHGRRTRVMGSAAMAAVLRRARSLRGTMLPPRRYTGTLSIVTATSCGLPFVATGAPAMQKDRGGLRYSQTWAQGTRTLARAGCCRLLHVILMPQAAPPLAKEQCTQTLRRVNQHL